MAPKTQKSPKKSPPKIPNLAKLPKGAHVKVYEITTKTLLFPVLFILG